MSTDVRSSSPVPASPRRRSLSSRLALGGGVFLVLLLAASAYFLVVRPSVLAQFVTERALPKVSASLGRPVTVGEVRARVFPNPSVRLMDVVVAGAAGEP